MLRMGMITINPQNDHIIMPGSDFLLSFICRKIVAICQTVQEWNYDNGLAAISHTEEDICT